MMLLEFKTKNYKSIIEEAVFSMVAAPKQSGLDYSLLIEKLKGKNIKALCSSVVYGPNASGKTNIIGAMDTFRSIVLRGNIRNSEERTSPNAASYALELIPNNSLQAPRPVEFSVYFQEEDFFISYFVSMNLGCFLEEACKREVLEEVLVVNGETVFRRGQELQIGNLKCLKEYVSKNVKQNVQKVQDIAQNSLNPEELFLTNGFKLIYSQAFIKLITDWFLDKFMVIYRADSMHVIKRFADSRRPTVYVEKTTNRAAKLFGVQSNAIGYVVNEEDSEAKLCSIIPNAVSGKNVAVSAELFESYGTLRFINIFPLVIRAIREGGILIVDELDASIHPMALMSIINIFHNDEINVHHAQLIFNTHNPIFLNSNLFRRDEIKFVEREDDSGNSTVYSLSDFGTSGEKGVRKHEDYLKNYFVSQYGAIKSIDFTPIFEELLTEGNEE